MAKFNQIWHKASFLKSEKKCKNKRPAFIQSGEKLETVKKGGGF